MRVSIASLKSLIGKLGFEETAVFFNHENQLKLRVEHDYPGNESWKNRKWIPCSRLARDGVDGDSDSVGQGGPNGARESCR
jgi:hypothetical protein